MVGGNEWVEVHILLHTERHTCIHAYTHVCTYTPPHTHTPFGQFCVVVAAVGGRLCMCVCSHWCGPGWVTVVAVVVVVTVVPVFYIQNNSPNHPPSTSGVFPSSRDIMGTGSVHSGSRGCESSDLWDTSPPNHSPIHPLWSGIGCLRSQSTLRTGLNEMYQSVRCMVVVPLAQCIHPLQPVYSRLLPLLPPSQLDLPGSAQSGESYSRNSLTLAADLCIIVPGSVGEVPALVHYQCTRQLMYTKHRRQSRQKSFSCKLKKSVAARWRWRWRPFLFLFGFKLRVRLARPPRSSGCRIEPFRPL